MASWVSCQYGDLTFPSPFVPPLSTQSFALYRGLQMYSQAGTQSSILSLLRLEAFLVSLFSGGDIRLNFVQIIMASICSPSQQKEQPHQGLGNRASPSGVIRAPTHSISSVLSVSWTKVLVHDGLIQSVTDAHILSYFSVFYTDLFDEVLVFESLSLNMIRWLVTCCHHVHS